MKQRSCLPVAHIIAKVYKTINFAPKLVKKILNNIIKSFLPLLLGVVILYWIYKEFDFSLVGGALRDMNLFWFTVSLLFGIFSHVLRGWRWLLTLAPLGYKPRRDVCVYSIFIAYAANLVLPRVGEVSRCAVLSRYDDVPFALSLGTVVTERLLDTLMVLLITAAAVLLQWDVFLSFLSQSCGGFGNFDILSTAGGPLVIALSVVAIAALVFVLARKFSLWAKVRSFFSRFVEGMGSLARMKSGWLFILETVGIWFCYFMQFYLCFFCFSFSSSLSLAAGLLLFVAGSIAVVVPTPNGAGPWHYVIIAIMVIYGVTATDASLFALIVHSSQTLLVALLGVAGILLLQMKKCITTK